MLCTDIKIVARSKSCRNSLKAIGYYRNYFSISVFNFTVMTINEEELKLVQEDLKWIELSDYSERREKNKILAVLIPVGCLMTAGVLFRGLHFMVKKDSLGQQQMMRYRVLSQGITIGLVTLGLFKMSS